jgi:cytochrome c-type biogenesis protein CcmF
MPSHPVAGLGEAGLLLALVVAAYSIGASVAGARRGSPRLVRSGVLAAHATTALITLSSFVMWFLLLSNDYAVKYVQRHSDASMPWYYKLTAFWGGLDGSIMWWVFLLAVFSSIAIHVNRERHKALIPWATAILFTVVAFFVTLIVFEKRPFDVFFTEAPRVGKDMNPLLQNPYMATHPPSLYLGFVSATVPFAFCLAALITGNLDDSWLASMRRWTLLSWYFLSQGLILGSLWAYEELGWGGYWGWDPVENAGFLPWLTATAFLHSIMIQERRGMLKVWNVSLCIFTFLLTIIGTFMTRSGVVQSVHAFGQDTELAIIFLSFIGFTAIFSFGWVIYRLPVLRSRNALESWASREFAFLLNNWILLSAAFFVLFATLFPTLSEWVTGERITVGPPFFTKWMTPIGLTLLFLMGVGPLIAWRKASIENLRQQFTWPALAFGVTVVGLQVAIRLTTGEWQSGWSYLFRRIPIPLTPAIFCFGLSAFSLATVIQEFWRGARIRQKHTRLDLATSLIGLVARNKRRYGGYLVHIAVVMMFVGFAGDAYKRETEGTLSPGQTLSVGRYTVRYDRLALGGDTQKDTMTAICTVTEGKKTYTMEPAKWAYKRHQDEPPTTEVAIRRSIVEDLYIVLNGIDKGGQLVNLKVVVNPLVNWIWLGFILLAIGTVVAYLPDRAYQIAAEQAKRDRDQDGDGGSKAAAGLMVLVLFGSLVGGGGVARAQMETAGSGDLHTARSDRERALFHQLKCLCSCMHSLNECGGECMPGVKRRVEVQQLIDAGKSDQEILDWSLGRYGQEVLRVPVDKGFNRLAWVLPYAAFVGAAGLLVVMARRLTKKRAPAAAPSKAADLPVEPKADDAKYEDRLDDELDKLS